MVTGKIEPCIIQSYLRNTIDPRHLYSNVPCSVAMLSNFYQRTFIRAAFVFEELLSGYLLPVSRVSVGATTLMLGD